MSGDPDFHIKRRIPSRKEAAVFRFKAILLQGRRAFRDRTDRVKAFSTSSEALGFPVIARSSTPLWTEAEPEERVLVAGKIQNLRIAVSKLDGLKIPAGEVFSFWKHVGRASRSRGFVPGREIREGCLIPNVGGGLCQISNALYDAALQANFEIVERHAHTQIIAGSLAESGRDATVFWNYVDLRFRPHRDAYILARLDSEELAVEFRGEKVETKTLHQIKRIGSVSDARSCASCGVDDCHRVMKPQPGRAFGKSAFLVDEYSPEIDKYIQSTRTGDDVLCVPLDGKRFRKGNYAWSMDGFAKTHQSLLVTAVRSYRSRKLATQGAARQKELLRMYEKLADAYARKLSFDVLHVNVHQNLLPYLWRAGHLGGRTFDVLMAALPMTEIQKRLDQAAELHPESRTLGDFRAEEDLLATEDEALKQARRIVTPQTAIASLFPERSELLQWTMPARRERLTESQDKSTIVFPASTVGRKGCYELREALREMDVRILTLGPNIEANDFWDGFDVTRGGNDWLSKADLVVLPAFVEHKPRRLLLAAASGIPVIASDACGLANVESIASIPAGDVTSLRTAIKNGLDI